ncbi:protein GRAVITROPIC IN THE LIGHT 1-like [Musa acuminata AAA Group]|uniref:protein GRAVITROPIC IN THE LIGHT 1-like n=1 Tax=Musa acuminata AAA Group TaxID=214697 RepID=UPI0031D92D55
MEWSSATRSPTLETLSRTFSKLLRLRCSASDADVAPGEDDCSIHKLKAAQNLSDCSPILLSDCSGSDSCQVAYEKQQHRLSSNVKEAMESLLANLFASISAVEAAYVQLQMAQSPYDPDSIQSCDLAIVSELKRVSELKQSYLRNHSIIPYTDADGMMGPGPALAARIAEQHNLIKTSQITTSKLQAHLELRDFEISSLQAELLACEKVNQALESKLHPGRSLCVLDGLPLSDLSPIHFLAVLRWTFNSIRSFVKFMVKEMESAGWDLDAAAGAIQPDLLRRKKPGHRTFAFQSYVCQGMFSDFHHRSYNVAALKDRSAWGRRRWFDEFTELSRVGSNQKLSQRSAIAKFATAKYQALVHPKMESSFFGSRDRERSPAGSTGRDFPDSAFFSGFAEMARRVYLLHCLFFSFDDRFIFQVRRGSRFSQVYMENVVEDEDEDDDDDAAAELTPPTVGFTVVPGFRVGRTLIQSKVYPSSTMDGA